MASAVETLLTVRQLKAQLDHRVNLDHKVNLDYRVNPGHKVNLLISWYNELKIFAFSMTRPLWAIQRATASYGNVAWTAQLTLTSSEEAAQWVSATLLAVM